MILARSIHSSGDTGIHKDVTNYPNGTEISEKRQWETGEGENHRLPEGGEST